MTTLTPRALHACEGEHLQTLELRFPEDASVAALRRKWRARGQLLNEKPGNG